MDNAPEDTIARKAGSELPVSGIAARFARAGRLMAMLAIIIGAAVLIGWLFGMDAIKSLNPSWIAMKFNAALCFVLSGAAVLLLSGDAVSARRRWIGRGLAVFVLLIGVATLVESFLGVDLRIDQMFIPDAPGTVLTTYPGRIAPNPAICFSLIGGALLLLDALEGAGLLIAQSFMVLAIGLSLLPLLGYVFAASELTGIGYSARMAAHGSINFILLSCAILCVRPSGGFMASITDGDEGGRAVRRLLPVAALAALLLGWIGRTLNMRAVLGGSFMEPFMSLWTMLVLGGIVFWHSRRVRRDGVRIRASNQQLRSVEQQLRAANDRLGFEKRALEERQKELACLYRIAGIIESAAKLDVVLGGAVAILPDGFFSPDRTRARIVMGGRRFEPRPFREGDPILRAEILVRGCPAGAFEVSVEAGVRTTSGGAFLAEEQPLLDAVAERIGRVAERYALDKELACLYRIAGVIESAAGLDDVLGGVAAVLPDGYFSPDQTRARIVMGDRRFESRPFREGDPIQKAEILMRGRPAGAVEVSVEAGAGTMSGGAFLDKERFLLDAVAERIGRVAERYALEQQREAANQQLRAGEQQMKAANQQLRAAEQQLRAANQQLRVTIADLKVRETHQALSLEILDRLNKSAEHKGVIRDILMAVKRALDVEAVAIRLKEGDDCPYFLTEGFPEHFVEKERHLCAVDAGGNPGRNASGGVGLECVCGDTISGRTGPNHPFFTKGGSFWTNSTTELLASATPEQRQARMLDRCHGEGYESVALVPVRSTDHVIGLLQLNDRRKGRFSLEMIEYLEGLGASVGIAVDRQAAAAERTKLEEQVRQSQKMESVGRLAGGVAHDFNNLLTAIKGYGEFLREAIPEGDPKRDDVGEILAAADRAASLTQQLLAFSRRQILNPQVMDINGAVGGSMKMLKRLIGEDVTLETHLAPHPCLVKADAGQIDQILLNLAVNARDAMPTGGTLIVSTKVVEMPQDFFKNKAGLRTGPLILLRVSDTGSGIPEEVKAHVFEPFFTTKEKGRGTGLGLSTVYGIVKQSGGDIELESALGLGTTFWIYLPQADAAAMDKDAEKEDHAVSLRGTETVLLIDDEDIVRRLGERALRSSGYTVLAAANGLDARKAIERHGKAVDLVITDVVMPGMSGRDIAREIAGKLMSRRTLYISGYTDDAIIRHGVLETGLAFLYKPFRPASFLRKVREVLDGPVDQARA